MYNNKKIKQLPVDKQKLRYNLRELNKYKYAVIKQIEDIEEKQKRYLRSQLQKEITQLIKERSNLIP